MFKKTLSMVLVICMVLCMLPAPQAKAQEADYVYSTDGYIYNWGTRGETATSLSANAKAFYTDTTYAELSVYAGGTGASDAPASDLYLELQTLMAEAQTHVTGYDETRYLFCYTDCQNSGDPATISAFYTGAAVGPAWDSGSTWNREHTWPNSKGDASGDGENDIMMLRPAASGTNSSRGNKAYGESSGFYDPNSASDGAYDLRGDVARIMLYVYVRWGNTSSMWGSDGVIESLDILLAWMEADPVDTWELGRNDSVQSITGTRNVFVDYPELAFRLFGAEIPVSMTTPSGEAANGDGCKHEYKMQTVVAPTCAEGGYTTYVCSLCGASYNGDKVAATGAHSYVDGACENCGKAEPVGKQMLIYYPNGDLYITTAVNNNRMVGGTREEAAVWLANVDENGYYTFCVDGQYMTSGATGNSLVLSDELTDCGRWEVIACDGGVYLRNVGAAYNGNYNQYLEYYYGFTTYSLNSSNAAIYTFLLISLEQSEGCAHENRVVGAMKQPTCTESGYTSSEICADCGATVVESEQILPTGHSYVDGACEYCGAADPSRTDMATLSFADAAYCTYLDAEKQVWEMNGVTVTNEKAASNTDVAGYSNPVRFYAASGLTVAYPGMTKIVVTCNATKYATALVNSISGHTVTADGAVVTIELDAAADIFVIEKLSAQVRVDELTVYAESATSVECSHTWLDATCTAPKTCSVCGATEGDALGHDEVSHDAKAPTCTEIGWDAYVTCSRCDYSTYAEKGATGHAWLDATCTTPKTCSVCGATEGELADHARDENHKCTVCGHIGGTCGENLTWTLDDEGTLTISGTGTMSYSSRPWSAYITDIIAVVIEKGVTNIPYGAFKDCRSLTSVDIPEDVTSIGDRSFYGCSSLADITIPDSVTSIGRYAFYCCTSLTEVTLGNGVTSIGYWAFYKCSSLTSVTIGSGVTSIDSFAFYNCTNLKTVVFEGSLEQWLGISFSNALSNPCCNDADLYINAYERVENITIPDGVTSIGDHAFYGCSNLTSVTIGDSITSIGNYAFHSCSSLTSVAIGDSVTSIGMYAFYGCSRLADITIPNSVISIGQAAFDGCCSLTSITIPEGVTSIGDFTFCGCSSLTSIEIPDSVTSIGSYAFSWCSSLTSITIPDSVTSIGYAAFDSCSSLKEVCFTGDAPSIADTAFGSVVATCYYPADNETYTDSVKANYGGTLTWVATCYGNCSWTDATCTTPKTCSLCGATEGDALGHDEISYEAQAPTCTEIGWDAYVTCSRCDYSTYAEKAAAGHTEEAIPAKDATCTETGLTEGKKCSACGEVLTAQKEIPAKGHADEDDNNTCDVCGANICTEDDHVEEIIPAKDATCTETGLTEGKKCSACGEILVAQEVVPALGHSYDSVVTAPTCTEQGYTTYTCECGDSYVDDYVDATGHTYENGICTVCGEGNLYGDANGDGIVDGKDLMLLRKYMANYNFSTGESTVEVCAGADANGDGIVDGKDLMLLRKYMANYNFSTGESTVVLGPQD